MKEHKSCRIFIDEKKGLFFVKLPEGDQSEYFPEMAMAIKWIDKLEKTKFKRFMAWAKIGGRCSDSEDGQIFKYVEVTSLDLRNRWRVSFNKKSETVWDEIYKVGDPHNQIIEEINKSIREIAELKKKIEALEKKLKPENTEDYRVKLEDGE